MRGAHNDPVIPKISFLFLIVAAAVAAQAPSSDFLLILDASGSMWGQVEGKNKIVIAREVLADITAKTPPGMDLGLVAYGHRREGDCSDIETIAAIGALGQPELIQKVNAINPKGKTPITASIEQALTAAKANSDPTTIVLLSDGLETCGSDPCAAVKKAKQSGANFLLHVIGFDLAKEDVAALECTAQAGGGVYFDAKNAADLSGALEQAVEKAEQPLPDSAVSILARANGELADATVRVFDAQGERAGVGRTYFSDATNPRTIAVPAGTYRIVVKQLATQQKIEQVFENVVVAKGETAERVADFTTGKVRISTTRNGALSDTVITVKTPDGKRAAGGRTYRRKQTNPRELEVSPGIYDVSAGSVEIHDKPEHVWKAVEVTPGETTDLEFDFPSGELRVGSVRGGALWDSTIAIVATDGDRKRVSGRTYVGEKTNPKIFQLTPGTYQVALRGLKIDGNPEKVFNVEVQQGGSKTVTAEF